MEEKPKELDSISFLFFIKSIHFLHSSISTLSSLCSHPLFSSIVVLYTLILLYTPTLFFKIVFSPVLNSTGILFLSLLRLGANEKNRKESSSSESRILDSDKLDEHDKWQGLPPQPSLEPGCRPGLDSDSGQKSNIVLDSIDQDDKWVLPATHLEPERSPKKVMQREVLDSAGEEYRKWALPGTKSVKSPEVPEEDQEQVSTESSSEPVSGTDTGHGSAESSSESMGATETGQGSGFSPYADSFLEWNMRGPLEIIYEAYEGEEEESEEDDDVSQEKKPFVGLERYPSLSMCYPESETDSSSDGDLPVPGKWDSPERMFFKWEEEERDELIEIYFDHGKRSDGVFGFEEDNLIEIDISPTRVR